MIREQALPKGKAFRDLDPNAIRLLLQNLRAERHPKVKHLYSVDREVLEEQQIRAVEVASGALGFFNGFLGSEVKMPVVSVASYGGVNPAHSTSHSSLGTTYYTRPVRIKLNPVIDIENHAYLGFVAHEVWHAVMASLRGIRVRLGGVVTMSTALEEGSCELADLTYRWYDKGYDLTNTQRLVFKHEQYREAVDNAILIVGAIREDLGGSTVRNLSIMGRFYDTLTLRYSSDSDPSRLTMRFDYELGDAFMLMLLVKNGFDAVSTLQEVALTPRRRLVKSIFNMASQRGEELSERLSLAKDAARKWP